MLKSIPRRATQGFLAAVTAAVLPLAAHSATMNIILSNMDVTYLGSSAGGTGALFDAMGGFSGGNLDPATSDDISTAVFELDNVVQGVLVDTPAVGDDLHADLRITGVGATIVKNVFHPVLGANGGGFGFDFFTDTGFKLRLGIDTISLFLTNGVFFFHGEADVLDQMLPFGLPPFATSQKVQFSYTATLPAVNGGLPTVSMAGGSGAFTISGIVIPEPAVGWMVFAAVGGFATFRRRRVG
jgi:hypothetical protein